jgi:hypothetical protein
MAGPRRLVGGGLLLLLLGCCFGTHACPVGQYPADFPGPPLSTCLHCPVHTSTAAQADVAVSAHDCRCDPGYVCVYYREVHATVSLNSTLSDFENDTHNVRSSFLSGVASAAGVTSAQVRVHFVVIRLNHRRRLHSSASDTIRVSVIVSGTTSTDSLLKLHSHLSSLQLITDSWVIRRHVLVLGRARGERN